MRGNLVLQIAIGIAAGVILYFIDPSLALGVRVLGDLFVSALRAVAPILVFVLVAAAIANQSASGQASLRPIVIFYLIGTLCAAFLAVFMSLLFPTELVLQVSEVDLDPPQGIAEVLGELVQKLVDNPVNALLTSNFIGILVWGVALGIGLRHSAESTRTMFADLAEIVISIVRVVIRFAPLGIMGLVAGNLAEFGLETLSGYARILTVLLSSMLIVALVINPILVFVRTRTNPYPLVLTALLPRSLPAVQRRTCRSTWRCASVWDWTRTPTR